MFGFRFMEQAAIIFIEARTMRDEIKAALQAGFREIEIESDNQIIIKVMQM